MLGSNVKETILWQEMDNVMLNAHPLHNRRMKFFNSKLKTGESLSLYMQRLIEDAGISEIQELTTSSIILHVFCHSVPTNESNKNIKNKVIEQLRLEPNIKDLGDILSVIKGLEADQVLSLIHI